MTTGVAAGSALADQGRTPRSSWMILICCLIAVSVQMVDMTIVNIALPSLAADLGATNGQQLLVLSAYTLAFACFLPTASRLGERFGRRRVFILALSGFTLVSVLCGAAQGAPELIILRVLQGACAALASAQTLAIISVSFPKSEHGIIFGIYGAVAGVAAMLGPTLGGLLISADLFGLGWRTIFLVNLPLGVVACCLGFRYLPALTSPDRPMFDVAGIVLSTTALFLLIYPLATGREKGWPSWQIAMLVAAVVLLAVFVLHQHWLTTRGGDPLLALSLFRARSFVVGSVLCLLFFSVFSAFFFTVSVTAQFGLGFSALKTGLLTLPFAFGAAVGSVLSPLVVRRIGSRTLTAGALAFTAALIYTALVVEPTAATISIPAIVPPLLAGGFAMGLFVAPLQATMLSGTSESNIGSASGTVPTIQQIGASIGLATISVLFFGQVAVQSESAVAAAQVSLSRDLLDTEVSKSMQPLVVNEFTRCATAQLGSPQPDAPAPGCPDTREGVPAEPDTMQSRVATSAEPALRPAARQAAAHTFLGAFDVVLWSLAALTVVLAAFTCGLKSRRART